MKTTMIIAAVIFSIATASYADEREPLVMRMRPEAQLRSLQNMAVDEEDDRIAILLWFLNENWYHRTHVRSDGRVFSHHTNPFRGHRGFNRGMLTAEELSKASELLTAMPQSTMPDDPLDMLILNTRMDEEWDTKCPFSKIR